MRILQTERLSLRWFEDRDADFVLELLNDPGWIRHIGDRGVRDPEAARSWIGSRLIEGYWRRGFGMWAVERRDGGEPLGMCGLVRRDALPGVDVGYAFLPRHRGRGYAREAVLGCLGYGRDALGLRRILAITSPDNLASRRVLEAVGMRLEDRRILAGETEEILVHAWEAEPSEGPVGDLEEIEALSRRFLGLFDNRGGAVPRLPTLPALCLPDARFVRVAPAVTEDMDLRSFVLPRAALLGGGRLIGFEERELGGRTELGGQVAHRWLRYAKSGRLDGRPHGGEGTKSLQFVRTAEGWRICSVLWEDDPPEGATGCAPPAGG